MQVFTVDNSNSSMQDFPLEDRQLPQELISSIAQGLSSIPSELLELYHLVYISRLRKWVKLQVQQMRSQAQTSTTSEGTINISLNSLAIVVYSQPIFFFSLLCFRSFCHLYL